MDDGIRGKHPVVGDAYAVLWHTDNDMDDAESGMRLVDEPTAAKLMSGSMGAMIADVIKHYKRHPLDDGNPAYRLFQN